MRVKLPQKVFFRKIIVHNVYGYPANTVHVHVDMINKICQLGLINCFGLENQPDHQLTTQWSS